METSENNTYTASEIELRFLKAVDYIITKNKATKTKPYTDNAISDTIFNNRSIIGKIRVAQRGITLMQLQKFAIHYGFDFNYFFRSTESMLYNPQTAVKNQNNITGDNVEVIQEIKGGTIYKGPVYHGAAEIIENVDKMMHTNLSQSMKLQAAGAIDDGIKKMVHSYQEKLRIVTEQRDQAKAKHIEISEKYIKLLEQNMGA